MASGWHDSSHDARKAGRDYLIVMEKYIVWILLAACVGMHLWMMRKGHHGNHDERKDDGHGDDKNLN